MPPISASCAVPFSSSERILLAHGEGGRQMRSLIRGMILSAFDNAYLRPLSDAALLPHVEGPLVMTTDASVVTPLFFPGGDIGQLAVYGSINDLTVSGATPLYLSLAFILEEGLPLEILRRVVASIASAARACSVPIVTGDTKVVPHGAADGLYLVTTGVGQRKPSIELGAHRVQTGDQVIVSGPIGDHGLAVLAAREGLEFESDIVSDCAPLHSLVNPLLELGSGIHFMRDPTRGGVAAICHELAEATDLCVLLEEPLLPIRPVCRSACEVLGLDPLHIANEGVVLLVVSSEIEKRALEVLHAHPQGRAAAKIGTIHSGLQPTVQIRGALGIPRGLEEPAGAPLPRIC